MTSSCVEDEEAAAILSGTLPAEAEARIDEHADKCSACRRLLTELARGKSAPVFDDAPLLERGTTVGRYVVEGVLGSGAMGIVYAAKDPELGRRVAIKFVRPYRHSERAASRLLLEAQSLAKLSHPNVVQVYDVGAWNERVFITLELVPGGTLTEWLAAKRRSVVEILAVYRAAGSGLDTAHRAGIVHRDFKPDNLLVGEDGRVRVTDFGLAAGSSDPHDSDAGESPASSSSPLTESGVVLGTPAYMAPELRAGGRADERSDQYSFSVALDEALRGASGAQGLPRRIRRAIDRGLSADRARRHPSMAALVHELSWDPSSTRRRWFVALGALGLVTIASVAAARGRAVPLPCTGGVERFDKVLTPARLAKLDELARGVTAAGGPLAAERTARAARFRKQLDDYRRDWAALYGDACEATRVRGDQSEELMELKMSCLDTRLAGVDVFVSLLERGDPAVDEMLASHDPLEPVASCGDRAALLQPLRPPKDPATRNKVQALKEGVARAEATDDGGDYKAARAQAAAAVAAARAIGYAPVLSDALAVCALVEVHDGDLPAGERDYTEAALVGEASHNDRTVAVVRTRLVRLVGSTTERAAEGRRLAEEAAAAIARLGGDARLEARLVSARADLAEIEEKADEARKLFEQALTLARSANGEGSLEEGTAENNLGVFLYAQRHVEEGLSHLDRALQIELPLLGAHHASVLQLRSNRATALIQLLRINDAAEEARGLVALDEEAVGPDHMNTAKALEIYAQILLYEPATRPKAVPVALRALAITEKNFGPDTLELANARLGVGEMLVNTGSFADAESAIAKALAVIEKRSTTSIELTQALELHGEALVGLNKLDAAAEDLKRSLELSNANHLDPRQIGTAEFALARALAVSNPARARSLATSAEAKLLATTFPEDERLDAVHAWLRERKR